MAAIGLGTIIALAWQAMLLACIVVSIVVAVRRRRRNVHRALWYLLVPVEMVAFTLVMAFLFFRADIDLFEPAALLLLAVGAPAAGWLIGHVLHRPRTPVAWWRRHR